VLFVSGFGARAMLFPPPSTKGGAGFKSSARPARRARAPQNWAPKPALPVPTKASALPPAALRRAAQGL
jgi:hypothetical protein